jgi:hypothetical protein
MKKRYRALRVIGSVYKVLGVIVAAFTLIGVLGVCASGALGGLAMGRMGQDFRQSFGLGEFLGGAVGGVVFALFATLYGSVGAVTFYGMGELIYLLIGLEQNTRETAAMLRERKDRP